MHEATRQLNLLDVLVDSQLVQEKLHWGALRGGYFLNVNKSLVPNSKGTYAWNAGRHGNVSAFSEEGYAESLDACVLEAHRAIAQHFMEADYVKNYILGYAEERKSVSRYERKPVI